MLPYVKKYVIVACVIAVVIPLVVSTAWPLFTGQIMAASVGGLILLLALFFGGFLVSVRVMGRKADELVDGYIALYDEKCDPQAFVDASRDIASSVVVPFTPSGAWFIGYYAQAMLDLGFVEKAEKLRDAMFDTIAKSKKASDQISMIVDLVSLMTKLEGPEETLPVVEKGIELIGAPAELDAAVQKDYLTSQAQILRARMNGELDKLATLYADVVSRELVPMRIRVECAWEEARIHFNAGDAARERDSLEFVVGHGNKLALVAPARARLEVLANR